MMDTAVFVAVKEEVSTEEVTGSWGVVEEVIEGSGMVDTVVLEAVVSMDEMAGSWEEAEVVLVKSGSSSEDADGVGMVDSV